MIPSTFLDELLLAIHDKGSMGKFYELSHRDLPIAGTNDSGQIAGAIGLLVNDGLFDRTEKTDQFPCHVRVNSKGLTKVRSLRRPSPIAPPPGEKVDLVDFAIITIREDEYSAVLQRFPVSGFQIKKNRTYAISRLDLSASQYYTVAMAPAIEQGVSHAQDVARDMIEDLDPQWILLVGIAGAVPDGDFSLGDVVVAKRLHDFSLSAVIEKKRDRYEEVANLGGPMSKEVQDLIAQLPALKGQLGAWYSENSVGMSKPTVDIDTAPYYGDTDFQTTAKGSLIANFGNGLPQRDPIVTARSIASSGSLIKHTQTIEEWKGRSREISAIEMELPGVYLASRRNQKQYPVLAIRGISDIIGVGRDPLWTAYAVHTPAAFALALIRTELMRQLVPPKADATP